MFFDIRQAKEPAVKSGTSVGLASLDELFKNNEQALKVAKELMNQSAKNYLERGNVICIIITFEKKIEH